MDPDNAARLQHLIETRHSSRLPFDPAWRVNEHELAGIVEAARWAPTAHNMQNFRLVVVDDPRTLDELGRLRAPVSPVFIAENYRLLSWSVEELEQRGVGLLATSLPSSWTSDPARVPANASRVLGELIAGAPMVLVVIFDAMQRAPASEGDMLGIRESQPVPLTVRAPRARTRLSCRSPTSLGLEGAPKIEVSSVSRAGGGLTIPRSASPRATSGSTRGRRDLGCPRLRRRSERQRGCRSERASRPSDRTRTPS